MIKRGVAYESARKPPGDSPLRLYRNGFHADTWGTSLRKSGQALRIIRDRSGTSPAQQLKMIHVGNVVLVILNLNGHLGAPQTTARSDEILLCSNLRQPMAVSIRRTLRFLLSNRKQNQEF